MTGRTIAERLTDVRGRIDRAARRSGRTAAAISLVAVTKFVGSAQILEAVESGVLDFGENYVQEALSKQQVPALQRQDVRWHLIGHLQRNKVSDAVAGFALIQSVDSVSLAHEVGKRASRIGRESDILLQVKLDPSGTKFGIEPDQTMAAAELVQNIPGVRMIGLMGMAPFVREPEDARGHFRSLRKLFDALPLPARKVLSMGMTADFEVAIEEGATLVRLGTAIFGPRTMH
jgi:pyridoxal phosphate enzyme (YggS family)